MRVLHVIETLAIGGAELLLADVLPRLRSSGVEVRLRALNGPATLRQRLRDSGVDADVLDEGPWTGVASLPRLTLRLAEYLRRHPVEIVHSHLEYASVATRVAARFLRPRPVLVRSLHNPQHRSQSMESTPPWRHRAHVGLDQLTRLGLGERAVAVSRAVGRDHEAHGSIPGEPPVDVILNAIDVAAHEAAARRVERFAARTHWGFAPGELALVSIGRLAYQKNFPLLCEAVRMLRRDGVAVRAVILGDGPDRHTLERHAPEGVLFRGAVGREDVVSALVASDVYVQTSHYEAFGMAILEAMATGRPVVATSVDGIPEVVANGTSGLLVPPAAPVELVTALATLAHDPTRREALGEAGLQRARDLFDLEIWATQTRDLYRSLLAGRPVADERRGS